MSTPPLEPTARRATKPWPKALLYAAAWLPLAVVYVGVLTWTSRGEMSPVAVTIAALLNTLGPAVLGAAVWWMTGVVPLSSPLTARFVALHIVSAVLFIAAWITWELLILGPHGPTHPPDPMLWQYVLPWQSIVGVMLYTLVAALSYMVRGELHVRELAVAAAHAEQLRAEAELAALRAHLNPHFLFNTLHGVMQLLREDPAEAERALEWLAELLRYVLRLDRAQVRGVSLEAEWQFVQRYLWLEQMRLGDRLLIEASVDEDAMELEVPPFTLQPLVENALRHGIAPRREGGRLRVLVAHTGDRLRIEVADDGVGAALRPDDSTPGLGLRAVVRRLHSHFGAAQVAMDIETAPGAGFTVRLTMPARVHTADAESAT